MDWTQWLITTSGAFLVAVVTAWLTVQLALKRFRAEKWFERRLEAYSRLVEALHFMHRASQADVMQWRLRIDPDEESRKELHERYFKGLEDVRRAADLGDLLFAEDVLVAIAALERALAKAAGVDDGWYDDVDGRAAAVEKALVDIRKIAKRELGA